jgi:hypothetical protein
MCPPPQPRPGPTGAPRGCIHGMHEGRARPRHWSCREAGARRRHARPSAGGPPCSAGCRTPRPIALGRHGGWPQPCLPSRRCSPSAGVIPTALLGGPRGLAHLVARHVASWGQEPVRHVGPHGRQCTHLLGVKRGQRPAGALATGAARRQARDRDCRLPPSLEMPGRTRVATRFAPCGGGLPSLAVGRQRIWGGWLAGGGGVLLEACCEGCQAVAEGEPHTPHPHRGLGPLCRWDPESRGQEGGLKPWGVAIFNLKTSACGHHTLFLAQDPQHGGRTGMTTA